MNARARAVIKNWAVSPGENLAYVCHATTASMRVGSQSSARVLFRRMDTGRIAIAPSDAGFKTLVPAATEN